MAPPVWFLPVVVALLLTQMTTPAVVDGAVRRGDCPDKCGNVTIPYPFGIGKECSWPGRDNFVVRCDEESQRPFVGNFEVLGVTSEKGEMLVNNDMAEACREQNKEEGIRLTSSGFRSRNRSPYLVSAKGNEFTAIGCRAVARMSGMARNRNMITGCITYCASIEEAAEDDEPCTGHGCCKASIATGISEVDVSWSFKNETDYEDPVWQYNPCMYAFVAKKGWYHFRRNHLADFRPFAKEVGNEVPLVLDWAIRDGFCPTNRSEAEELDYACVSTHSDCVNATNGKGYFCKCSDGYYGNPYIRDNCTDINECTQGQNHCKSGTCHNTDGGYECKCKFGQKGDGKSTCQPILPWSAAAIGITIVVSLVAVALTRKRMKDENKKFREHFNGNGDQLLKNISISIFTKENVDKITKNFSKTVGKGCFGQVYEGTIDDEQRVAVKRSIQFDAKRQKDFANEITIQSKIRHKNLVRLIGCCLETDVPMLVYEFIDRGSLYDMLHGGGGGAAAGTENDVPKEKQSLPLQVRLDISIGSAEALAYMHSSANQKILHGDVKSGNILLNENFSPRISDFGTCRLLSMHKKHTKFVVGDMGYIDPVYLQTGLLTEKSDVYSFGVVLLELITRKKARYDKNNSLPVNFVKSFLTESRAREMFDQELLCAENLDCLVKIGGIAVQCLREDVDERPTMMKVLEDLRRVRGEFAC